MNKETPQNRLIFTEADVDSFHAERYYELVRASSYVQEQELVALEFAALKEANLESTLADGWLRVFHSEYLHDRITSEWRRQIFRLMLAERAKPSGRPAAAALLAWELGGSSSKAASELKNPLKSKSKWESGE